VRIRGNTLTDTMAKAGLTAAKLAEAIAEPGLSAPDAERAIKNWAAGSDHPRCKAKHIRKIAQVLGVEGKDIAKFTSEVRNHRGSTRKARLLADLIRGKDVDQALNLLTFTTKKAAVNVKKALAAAIADAEQGEVDTTLLFVSESRVNEGTVIKRFQPKDRGRAHAILKQTSHITVSVQERTLKAGAR